MAKKKQGEPPQRKRKQDAPPDIVAASPDVPDRLVIEGAMRKHMRGLDDAPPETALYRAQDLIYQAIGASDLEERMRLAKLALQTSPDCADAYLLLAEDAAELVAKLELCEKAVAAGERTLGARAFREDVGHFWGLLATRPYMRARQELAHLLWLLGRRDEAIAHAVDMLRLNPNDNQGVRYLLSAWLLDERRNAELRELLERYDEESAAWCFTKTLLAFREHGDVPATRKLLQAAKKENKHVVELLVGRARMPRERPQSYSDGSVEEALLYAADSMSAWKSTPGAISWLKGSKPASKKGKRSKDKSRGPLPLVMKRLQKLPRTSDIWEADLLQFDVPLEHEGELVNPWITLVANRSNGIILTQNFLPVHPDADYVWDQLVSAMQTPMNSEPERPNELHVRPLEHWDALQPHLAELGIKLVTTDRLATVDTIFDLMTESMQASERPGMIDAPDLQPRQLSRYYEAAARFFEAAPWSRISDRNVIKVKSNAGERYAIVMGHGGITLGLSLYYDRDLLRRVSSGQLSDEECAVETVALTVTYEEVDEVPKSDFVAIEDHGFEIVGKEAYPSAFFKENGYQMRLPTSSELRELEVCLRAIPTFVKERRLTDASAFRTAVPTDLGNVEVELTWITL
ncbi:MAG: hypothetical protein KGM43_00035 [Planctomycetota bacterium]|nr:hypothetical protein [Planctomycetota bacterium]